MLKIGAVSYINAIPLFIDVKQNASFLFSFDHPSKVNKMLSQGIVDVGLISSESYLQHKDQYELLKGLGIGAAKEVMSVCLYTRVKKEKLDGKQIAIPNASETSVQLLKILCSHFWHVKPDFITFDVSTTKEDALQDFAAFLLIGDSCLMHDTIQGFEKIDLAKAWYKETHKPFVFAVFAARKEIYTEKQQDIQELISSIRQGHHWTEDKLDAVIKKAQEKLNLPIEHLRRYYQVINYELTNAHYEGLMEFDALRHETVPAK